MIVSTATLASKRSQFETGVHGDHFGQDLQHILRDGLVIYRDQVLGLRVDLESLVEAQSSFNLVGAYI